MKFNPEDSVRLKSGGPVMRVVYWLHDGYFCTWETEGSGVIGSNFPEETLEHAEPELPQGQQVLTDADAAADLAGTPRPAPWTEQRTLDLPLPSVTPEQFVVDVDQLTEPLTSFSGYLSTLPPVRPLDLEDDTPLPTLCRIDDPDCEACQ